MHDMRKIEREYGLGYTFEYTFKFYDYEQFMRFFEEFIVPIVMSFVSVLVVILVITSSFTATILVFVCIIMTDIFLAGLVYYWNLTLNPIVLLQICLGIGTSVDYSAHIAYAYLVQVVPKSKRN